MPPAPSCCATELGHLVVPAPVITETAWQIERNLGPISEAGFLDLVTTGELRVVDLSVIDYQRCIALIEQYADLGLGLVTTGELRVVDLSVIDYQRCIALIEQYADLGLGLVDASIVCVAENLGITTIATLNARDFRVLRPRHAKAFELIP